MVRSCYWEQSCFASSFQWSHHTSLKEWPPVVISLFKVTMRINTSRWSYSFKSLNRYKGLLVTHQATQSRVEVTYQKWERLVCSNAGAYHNGFTFLVILHDSNSLAFNVLLLTIIITFHIVKFFIFPIKTLSPWNNNSLFPLWEREALTEWEDTCYWHKLAMSEGGASDPQRHYKAFPLG